MTDQYGRMTYEQQRALREQQNGRAADRFAVENYGSGRRADESAQAANGAQSRQPETQAANGAAPRQAAARQSRNSARGTTRQSTAQRQRQRTTSRTSQRQNTAARPSQRLQAEGSQQRTARKSTGQASRRVAGDQTTRDRLSRGNYSSSTTASPLPIKKIGIVVILLVAVVLAVQFCSSLTPITVTVNGSQYELRGTKTMEGAIKASGLPINPGDLISLRGNVLEKSSGEPFSATVNDATTADPNYRLRDGDVINVTDGEDIVETYSVTEASIPYSSTITGAGAVHKFEAGVEGVMATWTGDISGETVDRQTTDPVDATCTQYNLNPGAKKIVALTFDDGPSSEYTAKILDILAENDAKATFFCIGTQVESYPDLVKREYDEGHQVCTHSYDHAEPVGGTNIGFMDSAGQIDEITHGMQTITDVTGVEASRVIRVPGGNLDADMVLNLQPYVDYDIGWNIDTIDWTLPGSDAIYNEIISAEAGEIILCHDGGGDRSETVEAIARAIPYLKSKGFTFVTMDELLASCSPVA